MAFLETSRSSLPCGTALPFQPEGLVKAGKAGKSSACRLMRAAVPGCHGIPATSAIAWVLLLEATTSMRARLDWGKKSFLRAGVYLSWLATVVSKHTSQLQRVQRERLLLAEQHLAFALEPASQGLSVLFRMFQCDANWHSPIRRCRQQREDSTAQHSNPDSAQCFYNRDSRYCSCCLKCCPWSRWHLHEGGSVETASFS